MRAPFVLTLAERRPDSPRFLNGRNGPNFVSVLRGGKDATCFVANLTSPLSLQARSERS